MQTHSRGRLYARPAHRLSLTLTGPLTLQACILMISATRSSITMPVMVSRTWEEQRLSRTNNGLHTLSLLVGHLKAFGVLSKTAQTSTRWIVPSRSIQMATSWLPRVMTMGRWSCSDIPRAMKARRVSWARATRLTWRTWSSHTRTTSSCSRQAATTPVSSAGKSGIRSLECLLLYIFIRL
jgi:hypothetical protein